MASRIALRSWWVASASTLLMMTWWWRRSASARSDRWSGSMPAVCGLPTSGPVASDSSDSRCTIWRAQRGSLCPRPRRAVAPIPITWTVRSRPGAIIEDRSSGSGRSPPRSTSIFCIAIWPRAPTARDSPSASRRMASSSTRTDPVIAVSAVSNSGAKVVTRCRRLISLAWVLSSTALPWSIRVVTANRTLETTLVASRRCCNSVRRVSNSATAALESPSAVTVTMRVLQGGHVVVDRGHQLGTVGGQPEVGGFDCGSV